MKVKTTLCSISGHVASVTIGYLVSQTLTRGTSTFGSKRGLTLASAVVRAAHRGVRGAVPREVWSARAPDAMALFPSGA